MRILLIDDHDDTRESLRLLLGRRGYHVEVAGSCADALRVAAGMAAGRLDVVVSDVGLPDGDGVELMKTIMTRHNCRAVALTGWGDVEDLRRYARAGIDRSLVKPVNMPELIETLQSMGDDPGPRRA